MMIYSCKKCNKEIALNEIDFEGATFCQCGSMELKFKGVSRGNYPLSKEALFKQKTDLIIAGIRDHFRE